MNMSKQQSDENIDYPTKVQELGKRAMDRGLIPNFVVQSSPDGTHQFYIPDEKDGDPLTAEEAYFQLKRLFEESERQAFY